MKRTLQRYAFLGIFFVMWMIMGFLHYTNGRDAAIHEARSHHEKYVEDEFRTEWFRDTFENHQSEYAQLFFQGLILVALADKLAKKGEEKLDEVLERLRALEDRLNAR